MPVERHRQLLRRHRGRAGQQGRGLVLPAADQATAQIADHVPFWHGVQVRQASDSGQASDGTEGGCGATGRGGIGGQPRAMLGR